MFRRTFRCFFGGALPRSERVVAKFARLPYVAMPSTISQDEYELRMLQCLEGGGVLRAGEKMK